MVLPRDLEVFLRNSIFLLITLRSYSILFVYILKQSLCFLFFLFILLYYFFIDIRNRMINADSTVIRLCLQEFSTDIFQGENKNKNQNLLKGDLTLINCK